MLKHGRKRERGRKRTTHLRLRWLELLLTAACFVSCFDLQSYNHPGLELDGVVTRMTLPIRALAFSPSGSILAVAGDGDAIKLVDTSNKKVCSECMRTWRALSRKAFGRHRLPPHSIATSPRSSTPSLLVGTAPTGSRWSSRASCDLCRPPRPTREGFLI